MGKVTKFHGPTFFIKSTATKKNWKGSSESAPQSTKGSYIRFANAVGYFYTSWIYLLKFNNRNTRKRYCSIVNDTIVQQSLAQLFNNREHNCSTVAGTIIQQLLARLFNSIWHYCSAVTGTIAQQSLPRLFNSHWHDCSIVVGMVLQQSLARFLLFSMLAEFNRDVQQWCWFSAMIFRRHTCLTLCFHRRIPLRQVH